MKGMYIMSKAQITHSRIVNGEVTLAVSKTGQGQKLIFFNGFGATQPFWKRVRGRLSGQYQVVTFDFRGHGKTSVATDYSFNSFLADAEAVMGVEGHDRPILVAHSLGADLAVWYAAAHPGRVAGIFIIDGALPANLIDDPEGMRRKQSTPVWRLILALAGLLKPFGIGYRSSSEHLTTILIELNERRKLILEEYAKLDCPVELVLAAHTSGVKGARAEKTNPLWRAGGEKLARTYPTLPIQWLESTHLLPLTKPAEIARSLDDFARRVKVGGPRDHRMRNEIHS